MAMGVLDRAVRDRGLDDDLATPGTVAAEPFDPRGFHLAKVVPAAPESSGNRIKSRLSRPGLQDRVIRAERHTA